MYNGFLKSNSVAIGLLTRLFDVFAILGGGLLAYYLRFDTLVIDEANRTAILVILLGVFLIFPLFDLYRPWRGLSVFAEARVVIFAWLSVITLGALLAYLSKTGDDYSRLWFIYWSAITLGTLVFMRIVIRAFLRLIRTRNYNVRNVLIVGAGELGQNMAEHIQQNNWTGLRVVGFMDDNRELQNTHIQGVPIIGQVEDLIELTRKNDSSINGKKSQVLQSVDQVWLTLPIYEGDKIGKICKVLENSAMSIIFVPDIFTLNLFNHTVDNLAGVPIVNLRASPIHGRALIFKALEDYIIATLAIVITSPLLLVIWVLIKLQNSGPVLFKQKRYGLDGREIIVWKFRTMNVMEDGDRIPQAQANDPRVTRLGSFLRRTSLDELPQFFNVLQGRMSVVGPRPHAVAHNEQYRELISKYMWRHKVKPGITGLAQVNGARGQTETTEQMKRRIDYDLQYLRGWSVWLDIKIVVRTIFTGFFGKNVY